MATRDVSFTIAWHSYTYEEFHGLAKCVASSGGLTILVTDLKRLYTESLNADNLEERCKELNPGLEVTSSFLLKHLDLHTNSALRDDINVSLRITSQSSEKLALDLVSSVSGVPLVWKYCLIAQGADEFYNLVTLPMVVMVAGFQKTQCEIMRYLHTVDDEHKNSSGARHSQRKRNFDERLFIEKALESGIFDGSIGSLLKNTFNSDGEEVFGTFMKAFVKGLEHKESAMPLVSETSGRASTQPEEMKTNWDPVIESVPDRTTQVEACGVQFKAKKPKRKMRL